MPSAIRTCLGDRGALDDADSISFVVCDSPCDSMGTSSGGGLPPHLLLSLAVVGIPSDCRSIRLLIFC